MPKEPVLSEELKAALKSLVDEFDKEDQTSRERQIRQWKRLQYMWAGFSRVWWSETAHDWRVFDSTVNVDDGDQAYYDKNINIFKAFLESIIAAMSAAVPGIKFKPDDADKVNDCLTAKGANKIIELIFEHNDAPLLFIKSLFVYCTQGMVAAYNYTDESLEYGSVEVGNYKNETQKVNNSYCPECGKQIQGLDLEAAIKSELLEIDEFDPGDDDAAFHNDIAEGKILCEHCQQEVDPELREEEIVVSRMVGLTTQPKSRQKIIVEGGLYVKVPNYARCQADVPYLNYSYETHYSFLYKKYKNLRDGDKDLSSISDSDGNQMYDRWGRLSPQYYDEYPRATPTVRNWWIRPSAFEGIKDDLLRKEAYKTFPDGCKIVYVNDLFAEACNEALDDHWTLTYNPLSEFLHFDPLGLMITSIQEIMTDLISLTLQTIEQGIPQTFADPSVLNFNAYRNTEIKPGSIFPAKPKSGKSISEAFYEVKTAQLSQEVGPFGDKVQELGQFLSGAMPAVFGGDQNNSSRTASQYAMSRAQALQRLQTPWKMITFWWKNIFGKAVPAYIKNMLADEKIVKSQGDSWINVVIRKAELDGKLGDVELEAADDLPMTIAQTKDVIMQLFNMNNPAILEALAIPGNLPLIAQAIGLTDFEIPGENDREKQLEEIQLLIQSSPITGDPDPMTGMPNEQSSIQPELLVDKHAVEGEVCREWLVDEVGRQCKVDNPNGYKNVLLHLKAHIEAMKVLQGGMQPPAGNQPTNGNGMANAPKPPQPPIMGPATSQEVNHGPRQ